ncbi:hypothetical protein CEXT_778101 [Caerostris extrusa]|uniref:Uncharacterized protein n=1 Tax=Caerostris extrusa TaxID=172846 RepID=A0AAV4RA94_CAEEX|nr:hypothetical protein CEXT_778101 [Caerostris extrusa]
MSVEYTLNSDIRAGQGIWLGVHKHILKGAKRSSIMHSSRERKVPSGVSFIGSMRNHKTCRRAKRMEEIKSDIPGLANGLKKD